MVHLFNVYGHSLVAHLYCVPCYWFGSGSPARIYEDAAWKAPSLLDAITAGSQIKEPIQIFHDAKASFHDSVTGLQTSFFLSCNCTLPSSQVQEVHLTLWIKLTLCTSFLQLSCAPPLQFKLHTSSTLLNYAQSICHSKLHTCQSWTKAFHATSTEKTCVPLSFMLIAKAFNAKCP